MWRCIEQDSLLSTCVSLLATLEPGISPCQTGALSAATISRLSVFVLPCPPPPYCQCHNSSSSTHLKAHFKTINLTLEEVLFVPESLPRYLGIRGAAGWETVWMNIKIRVMNINKQEQDFKLHVLYGHLILRSFLYPEEKPFLIFMKRIRRTL